MMELQNIKMAGFQLLVFILVIPYCLCVPHITNLPKTIIMNEGTPANEILYSLEVDTTGATVVNDNPSAHFDFDDSTLVVTAGTVVNYDEIPGQAFLQSYRLDFTITDGADSSIGYLTIQIRDQPDTAPWFGTTYYEPTGTPPTYNALMNEEQSTIFWTAFPPSVEVNDPDGNDLYSLTYSLGGASSVFTVDSSTGTISATSDLDFETDTQTYLFDLIATDPSGLAGTCSVSVSVVDLNDNSPIFDQGIYLVEEEEHDANAVYSDIIIQALTAVDIDAGAAITYALVGGDDAPPNSKFYLAGNIIKTSAFLDYEDPVVIGRNYQYDLIVTATDVGSPSVATATVRVKVTNRNEYSPEFTVTSGTFDFDEGESIGSSVVPSLLATDLDNGVDGAITFSITGTTPAAGCDFTIFPDTGEIITLGEFDYEAGPTSCTLVIQAVDNGDTPKTASPSYTATININNINDNEPFFTPTTLALAAISENHDTVTAIASISELAAGGDFMVDDLDTVLPDSTYWFASGNDLGLFTFDGLDIKLTQTIDLDNPVFNPSEYTLVIGVSDGDVPPLTGYATLIVEVTPENNHNPFIDHIDPGGTIQINENDPIGTLCATVYAEDRDVDDILAYAIFDGNVNNYFEIDSSTGEIRVANQVDYEAIAPNVNIDLRVTVTDLGGGMVTASVPLLIHNLNDFDPTCTTTSFLELISETDPAGTTIAQLDCSDLDPDTTLTYTIVPSTPDFTVDATGLVTVATGNSIDYDLQSVYNFNVEVTDDEGGLEICNIIVQIQPENTDTPEFIPAFWSIGPIPEDTDPSTSITQVSATDTDSYPLGVQLYEIITVLGSTGTDVTSDVIFDIDPSDGTIYIAAPLDYETETYYEVEIRATDGGGETGIGVLTIDIGNEDDNYPLCAFDSLIRSVPETTATSSIIVSATDLSCTDADGDTLSYTLTPSSPFSVDSSGYITLTGSLDYETANAYGLNLRVSDGGGLYTDIPIYVDVINENDSPPVFASSTYPVTIPEDTAAGIDVILVTAQNFDDPTTPEGQITYSIISGDPDGKFSIDANSGQIKCLGQLDRETEASYSLVIEASDSLSVDTTTVVVTVSDVNDEDPQCTETSFSIEVEETQTSGYNIMPLGCSDGDLGDTLTYSLLVGDSSVFSVSTGDLILTSSLDYDSGLARQYDLEITVVDSAGQSHVIEGTVHVKHVNEDAPAFQPTSLYSVDFEENQTPDTLVITVVATDTDSDDTEDGVVTYSFAASCTVDCAMFSIDPASGEISNSQELDRELNDAYTLVIEAADDAFTATATVEVTIIDVNDNTPIFANDIIEKDIEEGQGAITLVEYITAVDSDDPGTDDNGVVTYSIVDGNADGHFSINSFTGDLKTAQSLDYEEVTSYELKIVGTDRNGGVGSLSSTVTVRVNVLPKNEFSPSFSENPVERDVLEDVDIGDFLFLVNADDNDDGDDGDVTYQMNIHPKFRLDPSTGELFLKDKLDRESTSSYTLTLNAVDGGSPAKSGATTVIITVTDANDNTPVCSPSHISVTFPEDTASIIASLSCTDDDDGPDNNRLTYTIVSEDGVVGSGTIFSLSGDDVVLATGLDYETATEHTLKIRVEDNGLSPLSATVSITVEVTGVNEYDPVIAALTPITMLENAPVDLSVIKDIDATDADLGEYVTYEIIPDDPRFYCDPLTGEISLLSEIDADPGPLTISLTVRATDDGLVHALRYSEATLTINVDDVNDNNPVFLDHSYYFICSENSGIGDSIGTVSATDVDSGVNGDIKYTISPNDGVFTVGLTSGVINVGAALDLETTSSYTYTVIATDQGTGSLTGSSSVTIEITGYNDESPVLSAAGPVDIREDAGWGDSVITVAATDGDAGVDGDVGYIITGGSDGKFNIDYNTGLISVAGILDYETTTAYTLTVEATDHGIDPGALTDDITVVINVLPINDNKPTCNPVLYAVPVQDSAVANDPVLTPVCEDLDLPGDVLTYSMATSTYFDIDTSTGEITVKSDLAVAPSPVYSLFVEVIDDGTDPGALSSTFTVVIELQGDNKMAPDFDSNVYILTAMEDQAPGTVITTNTVYAEDTDVGSAGRVTYTIIDGNDSGTFRINGTTGELFIEKSLDRERQEIYYLNVSAEDDGSPSYITYVGVEVTVLDVNDEAPICDPLLYTASIVEEDPTILTIATVICNDSDKAPTDNSDFEFEIGAGNDGTAFSITPDTGEVKNVGALDLETQEFYQLIIHAVDKGTPSLTGTATVNVQVTGVNDNEPYFSPVTQGTIVNEANPLQVSFYQVVAYDDDQHQDGAVMFNITEGNDNNIFGINSATGELHLVNPLDRETLDTHTLTIEAIDLATDPALRLTGTGTVIVTVTDSNDEAPLCDPIEAYVSFTENAVPNDIITTLNCTDADLEPPNNDFTLSILSGNDDNKFYLFQNQIKVTDTLDYEEQQQYVLEIKLIDKGTPTQTGYTTLTINIIPVNEFAPVYEEDTYIFDIYEDVSLRTTVGSVKATDEDYNEDYHGIPRYYIKNGNDENKFAIDPETGEIFTIGLLNREVTATYDLLIMAQDSTALRNDQLDVNQTVTINVIDVNDNKPEFRPNAYFQVIMETLPPGSTILMVTATDADEGTNAEFTFEIESGNVDNTFYFDGDYLVVNKKVDLNVAVFYRLTVNVIDHGTYPGPLQNYGVITLLVDSTNEYNPTFDQEDDILLVSEGTKIGAHIYTAIADDFDVGCHGTLRYIVEDVVPASGVNHFYIDELYGEMLLSSYLDREEQSTYDVTITAIDDSCNDTTDIRTDSLVVHVVVTDENDNSPEFTESGYVFYVTENIPLETLIDRVRATDVDEGVNAQIEYTMDSLSYTDKFTVDLDGGGVTTSGELDFEEQRAYSFLVVARDKGTEPRSTIVTVIVNLLDENDNEPILYPDVMHVAIDENVEEGTLVTLIDAYDLDSTTNGEFIYEIIDGDINDAFVLDPLKGELYTSNNILDREYIDVYTLIIKTTDMGTPPMFYTGTVTVTVLDLNDNDPVANPVFYEETVSEDVSIGTQLLDIEATDSDILENGNLTYSFLTGNTASRFSIYETTGVIRVAKSLNRESVDEYTLYILIEDQGDPVRSATAVASIYVEDVNDSPPRFTPRNRAFSVLENSPAGVVLGNMYAEDQDLGTNAEFEFALIAGSGFGKFSVNSINGAVTLLVSNLDREARSSYQLIVRAQDNGSPPLFTDSTVTIAVTDINDHTPTFDRAFYDAEVIENAVPGTSVLIVHAVDKDTGNNAALTYSIDSTNVEANTYFQIDSDTGIIRVRDGIDYETYKEIIFDVNVEDGGDVPLADVTRVTISVVDENDNEPIISPCFINNEISYLHATSKGILATYAASDADASQQVTFELSPSSYVFQIGSNTGTITAIPGVEPADDAKYVLQLLARDDGYPQQTSDPCLARIDTFNPYIYMLDLHMSSTTQSEFEGKKVQLLSSLNSLLRGRVSSARVGISHLSGGGASTASRRLLAADDLVIHVYAVENSEADNVYGIENEKVFLTNEYLHSIFAADIFDNPVGTLKENDIFKVQKYPGEDWYRTPEGIAGLTMGILGLIALFTLPCLCYCCCKAGLCDGCCTGLGDRCRSCRERRPKKPKAYSEKKPAAKKGAWDKKSDKSGDGNGNDKSKDKKGTQPNVLGTSASKTGQGGTRPSGGGTKPGSDGPKPGAGGTKPGGGGATKPSPAAAVGGGNPNANPNIGVLGYPGLSVGPNKFRQAAEQAAVNSGDPTAKGIAQRTGTAAPQAPSGGTAAPASSGRYGGGGGGAGPPGGTGRYGGGGTGAPSAGGGGGGVGGGGSGRYDGKAVDPATGKTYEYNKTTGERRWIDK